MIAPEGAPTGVVEDARCRSGFSRDIFMGADKSPLTEGPLPLLGRGEYGVVLIYLRKIWGGVTERIAAEAAPTGGAENAVCRSDFNRDVAGLDNRSYYGTI